MSMLVVVGAFAQKAPGTLVLDGEALAANLRVLDKKDSASVAEAVKELKDRADKIVAAGKLYSVMNKKQVPPSGDRHDYMSQAPYFWPDPKKPNGLPYLHRDGERNPELLQITDSTEMGRVINESETLAITYYFTGNERYARHATALLRTWFLDPKTRQNPNLNFGQGVPGLVTGRPWGLIETRELYRVVDAAILLQKSRSWRKEDHLGLQNWFSEYLRWMTESPLGKAEGDARNNHGTYYDVQVIAYSIFTGKRERALRQLEVVKQRIQSQIEPDGRQPHELARTLSWNYVNMNLLGFFTLARLGDSLGADLWNYQTSDGRSVRKAFEWIVPFVENEMAWSHKQIKPRSLTTTTLLLRTAARRYKKPEYRNIANKLQPNGPGIIERLGT